MSRDERPYFLHLQAYSDVVLDDRMSTRYMSETSQSFLSLLVLRDTNGDAMEKQTQLDE